jgi:hypothetical protein
MVRDREDESDTVTTKTIPVINVKRGLFSHLVGSGRGFLPWQPDAIFLRLEKWHKMEH